MSSHQEQSIIFVLCDETALREDHRLRVFENGVLSKIYGPKRDKISGNWGRLHNDEMGGACSTYGEKTDAYRVLVGEPEGKKPLGRPKRKWENNIEMDLQEVG
jgi:hypothetical protein